MKSMTHNDALVLAASYMKYASLITVLTAEQKSIGYNEMEDKMEEKEIKSNLRSAINEFCRWRVNHELCEPDGCDFCCVNRAYDMARDNDEDYEDWDDD